MQQIVLIPAYQPGVRLLKLVEELHDSGSVVLVIDDGSGSSYDDIFNRAKLRATVLRYEPNRGKGEALRYGLSYIKERYPAPYIVTTADSDGQHRTQDIIRVGSIAEHHPDSLVLGKRFLDKSAPLKSRLGNGLTRALYHLVTGRKIYETQTGLRAFSDRQIERFIKLPGHRYEYEIDMMLVSSDVDIIEEEIQTVYFDNNAGTHFRAFEDTVSLNKEFFRYKIPSFIAATVDYLLFILTYLLSGNLILSNFLAGLVSRSVKYPLNRNVFFAEKATISRYLITAFVIIVLDTFALWGLTAIGMNVYTAKLISGILMIFVSILIRKIFMAIKYRK